MNSRANPKADNAPPPTANERKTQEILIMVEQLNEVIKEHDAQLCEDEVIPIWDLLASKAQDMKNLSHSVHDRYAFRPTKAYKGRAKRD